jgi:hypothetical protein
MSEKKSLESRIRGWLPKNPNAPRNESFSRSCLEQKQTILPIAGSLLTIIGSFAVFFIGIFQILPFSFYVTSLITRSSFIDPFVLVTFPFGMFNIICFIIGLKAGTYSKERQSFKFSVVGSFLVLLAMLMTVMLVWITTPMSVISYLRFGLPVAVISTLGFISIVSSQKEFQRYPTTTAVN